MCASPSPLYGHRFVVGCAVLVCPLRNFVKVAEVKAMLLRHLPILELHKPTPPPTIDFFENLDVRGLFFALVGVFRAFFLASERVQCARDLSCVFLRQLHCARELLV